MEPLQPLFLNYDLSVIAKDNGFDKICFGYYSWYHRTFSFFKPPFFQCNSESDDSSDFITAPLYQQIIDWFRKEHDIYIYYQPYHHDKILIYHVTYKDDNGIWTTIMNEDLNWIIQESFKLINEKVKI